MKNPKFLIILFVIVLFSSACNKDNNNDLGNISEGTFEVKIDGKIFKPENKTATLNDFLGQGLFFGIQGTDVDLQSVKVKILNLIMVVDTGSTINAGEYNNCDNSNTESCVVISYSVSDQNMFTQHGSDTLSNSAKINFTSLDFQIDGKAIGTFEGTLLDNNGNAISLTEGKFHLKIEG